MNEHDRKIRVACAILTTNHLQNVLRDNRLTPAPHACPIHKILRSTHTHRDPIHLPPIRLTNPHTHTHTQPRCLKPSILLCTSGRTPICGLETPLARIRGRWLGRETCLARHWGPKRDDVRQPPAIWCAGGLCGAERAVELEDY
jgi:hypothetical protein